MSSLQFRIFNKISILILGSAALAGAARADFPRGDFNPKKDQPSTQTETSIDGCTEPAEEEEGKETSTTLHVNLLLDDWGTLHYQPAWQSYQLQYYQLSDEQKKERWRQEWKEFEAKFGTIQDFDRRTRNASFELINPEKLPGWANYLYRQGRTATVWWETRFSKIPDDVTRRLFSFLGDEPQARWEFFQTRRSEYGDKFLGIQLKVKFFTRGEKKTDSEAKKGFVISGKGSD